MIVNSVILLAVLCSFFYLPLIQVFSSAVNLFYTLNNYCEIVSNSLFLYTIRSHDALILFVFIVAE